MFASKENSPDGTRLFRLRGALIIVVLIAFYTTAKYSSYWNNEPVEPATEIILRKCPDQVVANKSQEAPQEPTMPPTGLRLRDRSETLECKRTNLQYARDVFVDDKCYPPTFVFKPLVLPEGAGTRATIEPMATQNWNNLQPSYTIKLDQRKEPATVKTFSDAVVFRKGDSTYLKNDYIFTACERCLTVKTPVVDAPSVESVTDVVEEAILASSQIWGDNYFHSLSEKIFPLSPARLLLESNPNVVVIVENTFRHMLEFLALLGIPESRMKIVRAGEAVRAKIVHMTFFNDCGWNGPQNVVLTRQWIRDRFRDLYASERSKKATSILVIDRLDGGECRRCLRNTGDIITAIKRAFPQREVNHVRLAELPVKQQMEAMATSEVIVAPHGAGLTNLVFCPDHAKVVEIQNHPSYFHYAYFDISVALNLEYRAIPALRTSPTTVDYSLADPARVVDAVDRLLNGKGF